MAGTNIAAPMTADTAFVNPAGLAMTFSGTKITFNGQWIQNGQLDPNNEAHWSLASSIASQHYPYGFGIAIRPVHNEQSTYLIGGQNVTLENSTREIIFSGSKVFFKDKLSLGAGFILGHNYRSTGLNSNIIMAPGFTIGTLYQLPWRTFIASTLTTPINYPGNLSQSSGIVTDFFQEAYSPWRTSLGLGWIPNRHFQLATAVEFIGVTKNAGLLSQQTTSIGTIAGFIPRVGLAYNFAEFSGFKGKISMGTYIETPRIDNAGTRLHWTTALQVNPWIFYFGAGIDVSAPTYQNIIYAAGIDTIKILELLDLIPSLNRKFDNTFFPNVNNIDDTGLSKPLLTPGSEEWQRVKDNPDQEVNILQVGRDLPGKIGIKIKNAPKEIINIGPSIIKNVKQVVKDTQEALNDEDGIVKSEVPVKAKKNKSKKKKIKKSK
ncbi:MAG: hypothetical protein KA715_08475 [Xanthomonadaceae bacterium]|nr:hypothetical protein [Xanthomonadaceae bacterium]